MEEDQMSSTMNKNSRTHADTFKPSEKGKGLAEDVIDPLPVSYKLPESDMIYPMENFKNSRTHADTFRPSEKGKGSAEDVIDPLPVSYKLPESDMIYPKLSIEDRKEGWIRQPRKRKTGREDKYYYHLKSGEWGRSLVEVHDYIKHGIPIEVQKKMKKEQLENKQKDGPQAKRQKGSSLLSTKIVGTYNLQTKAISLQENPPAVEKRQPQPIDDIVNPSKEADASGGNGVENRTEGESNFGQANASADTTIAAAPNNVVVVPYIMFELLKNL